jgi:FAD-dependent urate hydroxylase
MSTRPVAVVGAGPYGLACAAHLRAAGVATHVFGRTMEFWEERMPVGMLLRSPWQASRISDPDGRLSLDAFEAAHGRRLARPVPIEDFVAYGHWFADAAVPDLDERRVRRIDRDGDGFILALDDGETLGASRVVLATGLEGHEHRPPELASNLPGRVLHSVDVREPRTLAGESVLIVGCGQSAIELAALLAEAGAQPEVIARARRLRWLVRSGWLHRRKGRLRTLLYPPTDVGPPILNQIVAAPYAFRSLPTAVQARVAYRSIRPAAAEWLVQRTAAVPIHTGTSIRRIRGDGDAVAVELSDGSRRHADRVVLATGFKPDIRRHALLAADLLAEIEHVGGYPRLRPGLESSVSGLHMVGALSAHAFGPVVRFVSGTWFTAAEVARVIGAAEGAAADRASAVLPAMPAAEVAGS